VLMFWRLSNKCFLETISSQISSLSSYDIFKKSITEINPLIEEDDIARLLAET
jgi:hypothetical protein